MRLQALVLIVGMLLMAIKFLAWHLTGSTTILSDAMESIVNVVAGAFALYSLWLAARPRDVDHPYGHGKIEFISAGMEGMLVLLAGVGIIWTAVNSWIEGEHAQELDAGILLTGLAGVANLGMGIMLQRMGRRMRSITMEASGTHLLSDAWSTAAMVLGLGVIHLTGLLWLDHLFACLFAVYIMVTGFRIVRRSVGGIMDETDAILIERVIAHIERHRRPQWVDLHNLRIIRYGAVLHVDCHVTLPWYFSLEQAHAEIAALEQLVAAGHEQGVELFIHMDPCIPRSCSICTLADCPQRRSPLRERITWTSAVAMRNAKHGME